MSLQWSEIEKQRFKDAIEQRSEGRPRPCPICHQRGMWDVMEGYAHLVMQTDMDEPSTAGIAPCAAVVYRICGLITLHAIETLGLLY